MSLRWSLPVVFFMASMTSAQYDRAESAGDFALPVTLLTFSASGSENAIILQWETASEIDMLGYNLYRSLESQGTFDRINPTMITARGTWLQINEYQYIDSNVEPGRSYFYKLASVEINGRETFLGSTISAASQETARPDLVGLKGNFPAPFNSSTRIEFSVYETDRVLLQVYDVKGRKIATLLNRVLSPGEYSERFDGDRLPSGIYLCRLIGGNGSESVHKMILLR